MRRSSIARSKRSPTPRTICFTTSSPRHRPRTAKRKPPRPEHDRQIASPLPETLVTGVGGVMTELLRYAAFTMDGQGGNPAGVVLDASGLDAAKMQGIAADVGYSETAFLVRRQGEPNGYDARYFAPLQEVPFCGHATIAAAVALGERSPADELIFHTPTGVVSITTFPNDNGELVAEMTSVAP